MSDALSEATLRAYRRGAAEFLAWCKQASIDIENPAPEQVAQYFLEMPLAHATVQQHRAAVRWLYRERGNLLPVTAHALVEEALHDIRTRSRNKPRSSLAITRPMVLEIIRQCGYSQKGLRDRALFACAFALKAKFSLILPMRIGDLDSRAHAVRLGGHLYPLPDDGALRPWHLLLDWIKTAGITRGVVFQSLDRWGHLSGHAMAPKDARSLFLDYCRRIGRDPRAFNAAGFTKEASFAR